MLGLDKSTTNHKIRTNLALSLFASGVVSLTITLSKQSIILLRTRAYLTTNYGFDVHDGEESDGGDGDGDQRRPLRYIRKDPHVS